MLSRGWVRESGRDSIGVWEEGVWEGGGQTA